MDKLEYPQADMGNVGSYSDYTVPKTPTRDADDNGVKPNKPLQPSLESGNPDCLC